MTGEELNEKFERGLFGRSAIKKLFFKGLEIPQDKEFTDGVEDSVTKQQHPVSAVWNSADKSVTISLDPLHGTGLWIPYLGIGYSKPKGMAKTKARGLGTYTASLPAGAAGYTWVATGPFSGCYAVTFTVDGSRKVFAHIITPAAGATAESVDKQATDIADSVGAPRLSADQLQECLVKPKEGVGYVFWTLINGVWWRRVIGCIEPAGASEHPVNSVGTKQIC